MSRAPKLPRNVVALDSVDSTNAEAGRLAAAGAADGTLVWARQQTAGYGRRGRAWVSPPGNLYCSLILRPDCPPIRAAQLGFVAALALAEALDDILPPASELAFKWPNDILVNRRKVAGILLESSSGETGGLDWLILGLGVNIESFPDGVEFPATSLKAEGCGGVSVVALLEAYGRCFQAWSERWRDRGFEPVRAAWFGRAVGVGEAIEVRLPAETLRGRFAELDAGGALVMELEDGRRRTVTAADVFAPAA